LSITLASWNVNSLKARSNRVAEWLDTARPDVLLLQELKCQTDAVPSEIFQQAGYRFAAVGQKTYNGVLIASRGDITVRAEALPGDPEDEQARYLEVETQGLIVVDLYLPNGNPIPGPKFDYKLAWMQRLHARLAELMQLERPVVVGGDFNVIPAAEDAFDIREYAEDALWQPESRRAFDGLLALGYVDALRALDVRSGVYTYWDYQKGRWPRGEGIRIDHWLLSPEAADRLNKCWIDRQPRGLDKASDHTPILVTLDPEDATRPMLAA